MSNPILTTPLATLASSMAWANKGNGALLLVTSILGLIHTLTHPGLSVLGNFLISVYVGGGGALLLLYEFTPGAELRHNFGFMYTYLGRAAFLLLVANLAWTCAPLGLLTALVTNANALLSAYIIWQHPTFVSGQASAVAIGGFDGDDGEGMIQSDSALGGGRRNSFGPGSSSSFDPASDAARARMAGSRPSYEY